MASTLAVIIFSDFWATLILTIFRSFFDLIYWHNLHRPIRDWWTGLNTAVCPRELYTPCSAYVHTCVPSRLRVTRASYDQVRWLKTVARAGMWHTSRRRGSLVFFFFFFFFYPILTSSIIYCCTHSQQRGTYCFENICWKSVFWGSRRRGWLFFVPFPALINETLKYQFSVCDLPSKRIKARSFYLFLSLSQRKSSMVTSIKFLFFFKFIYIICP